MSPESDKALDSPLLGAASPGLRRLLAHNDILFALGLATVLATLVIPLPTALLDMLLGCSIAIAIATMVIVLSARESLELSTFPSLLLLVTLFRLSLNVASTRLILSQANAGNIIQTFGMLVAGGSLIIGLVVFLILVIIQFVVITKGAERISEVAARFNLDAMPGKQMAIDADLNAGLIGEEDARSRREKIVQESEFYGAMDGASKFIRGDAIAALIITGVNLIGGFVIGMSRGLEPSESVKTYAILAVGDGLVTQIPAVIISTASGFLISKTATKTSLSQDLIRQMLSRSRPLGIAAFLFAAMILVPGFPKLPFVVLSLGTGFLAHTLGKFEKDSRRRKADSAPKLDADQLPVEELLDVDKIAIHVGPRLIKTVDPRRKSSLSHRIAPLRRKFAQQYGIILPLVRLRDNVSLDPNCYEIRLYDHVISTGRLEPEKYLAMDPGTVAEPIEGQDAREPVFDLPALWIDEGQKEQAEIRGYTVVDPESVLITHLSETLRRHAYEMLARDDVQRLLDRLRDKQPALVNSVVGEMVPIGLLHRVLQNLLKDGIPIRDLVQILETLGDHASKTKDPGMLSELARKALVRTITEQHGDAKGGISALTLQPPLEYELRNAIQSEGGGENLAIPPDRAVALTGQITEAWKTAMDQAHDKTVLLCDFRLRPHLASLLARQLPQLAVLAYDEIALGTDVTPVGTISLQEQPVAAIEGGP